MTGTLKVSVDRAKTLARQAHDTSPEHTSIISSSTQQVSSPTDYDTKKRPPGLLQILVRRPSVTATLFAAAERPLQAREAFDNRLESVEIGLMSILVSSLCNLH